MAAPTVVVAGALANKVGNGGEAWVRMSWACGLARLGCDVWFLEEIADRSRPGTSTDEQRAWFTEVTSRFGLRDRSILLRSGRRVPCPVDQKVSADVEVGQLLAACDLLVNISGNLRDPGLLGLPARTAYVDLDPGFTQVWAAAGSSDLGLGRHDLHFTVGELIGTDRCVFPSAGYRWLPCRQPVVLEDWPARPLPADGRFTTVATWRCPFGGLRWDGVDYGLKVHEFRRVGELPGRTPAPLELALDIHPDDDADRRLLDEQGWHVRDAAEVGATTDAFRSYVQSSMGEFSVAQGVYAHGRTGWFSDRTARYLASGRPAVVQHTGWGDDLDIDAGLLTFGDPDGARAAVDAVCADLPRHSTAARRIAEQHFASNVVLARFLELADVSV